MKLNCSNYESGLNIGGLLWDNGDENVYIGGWTILSSEQINLSAYDEI
ncbi:hypothetical protein SPD48_01455 [Pseudogracilibacillus sp. SE30717A]